MSALARKDRIQSFIRGMFRPTRRGTLPIVKGGQGRPDYPSNTTSAPIAGNDNQGVGFLVRHGAAGELETIAFGCARCGVKCVAHSTQPNYARIKYLMLCHDCVQGNPPGRGVTTMGDEAARLPVPGDRAAQDRIIRQARDIGQTERAAQIRETGKRERGCPICGEILTYEPATKAEPDTASLALPAGWACTGCAAMWDAHGERLDTASKTIIDAQQAAARCACMEIIAMFDAEKMPGASKMVRDRMERFVRGGVA